jgi:hypothetical protein
MSTINNTLRTSIIEDLQDDPASKAMFTSNSLRILFQLLVKIHIPIEVTRKMGLQPRHL